MSVSRAASLLVPVLLMLAPVSPAFARQGKPTKMLVRFLATSTSVRISEGDSEDVYLVEVRSAKRIDGAMEVARLVDRYPAYLPSLPLQTLRSTSGTVLHLVRDATCDTVTGQMPIRTAPGDPEAILPERLGYHVDLPAGYGPGADLPCYRLVRR